MGVERLISLIVMTLGSYRSIEAYHFKPQEGIPNHQELPVLIYGGVLSGEFNIEQTFDRVFSENAWDDSHRRQISRSDHFHSDAHEALGVVRGYALLKIGGPSGKEVELREGDLILLPVGTAHRMITSSSNFQAISAYPGGQENKELVIAEAGPLATDLAQAVKATPRPKTDPCFGHSGPLFDFWY